jgi:predicted patatin/cPLA2 family phospholipase
MPFLCRRVQVGEETYLDGGIGRHLPLGFLQAHPEYDRVVVVLTRPLAYRKTPLGGPMVHLAKRLYGKDPKLLEAILGEAEVYAQEREELARLEKEGKIFLVQPRENLNIGRLERKLERLQEGYALGCQDGTARLEAVKEYFAQ